jgi:hypothetical protein
LTLLPLVALLSAATVADTQLVYNASFGGGSLVPSVDKLGYGAMKPGDTEIANTDPRAIPERGEVTLSVTRPVGLAAGTVVSSGLFIPDRDFDQGSRFVLQATFVGPDGPSSGGWAAASLSSKTGDESDLNGDVRLNTTINVRAGGTARLNVPFGAASQTFVELPGPMYNAIFRKTDPEPFTLQLLVDRITGTGRTSLMVEGFATLSRTFQLSDFKAESGPAITAVGTAVGNANAPGQTISVRVRDFRIYTGKHRCPASQPLC